MELVQKGGRPVKTLTPDQIEEVHELAAVLNKSQLAEFFGMTDKTFLRRLLANLNGKWICGVYQ